MKIDLRVIKTRKAIEEALLELIEEKGFTNVHMNDIANKACINRNTIYLHYTSKEDIIQHMVDRLFQEQFEQVDIDEIIRSRFSKKRTAKSFVGMFNVLNEQIELYRLVLTEPSLSGYLDKVINNIRTIMLQYTKRTKKNEIGIEFILSGIYGVLRKWIIYDFGTIEENADTLSNLIFVTYRHLQFS